MIVITDSVQERSECIGIYKIFTVNNVSTYTNDNTFNSWIIDTVSNTDEDNTSVYFIIDTLYHLAFSHWVYECAIYLDLFIALKERYPTLKLHLKTKRKFKELFCSAFGIQEEDIVYTLPSVNTCIFPSPISMKNNPTISSEYIQQIQHFFTRIEGFKSMNKVHKLLIMPRQVRENFDGNDRSYDMSSIFDLFKERHDDHYILNTDSINDLKEQIDIVSSAETTILIDGSAFLVNGLFSRNATLLIIDKYTLSQKERYKKMNHIIEMIKQMNNITIEYFSTVDELHKSLCAKINTP